jgi:cell division control protein 6
MAQNKMELDRVTEVVKTLPTQSKLVLLSIIFGGGEELTTGELYGIYEELCREVGIDPLTQRRIADLISELDMLGIITARVISKGRYGRTRHIRLSSPIEKIKEVLGEDDIFRGLKYRRKIQGKLF